MAQQKKFEPDAGYYTAEDTDVHAIIVRWDNGIGSLRLDLGGVDPSVASDWLWAAHAKAAELATEFIGDCLMEDE